MSNREKFLVLGANSFSGAFFCDYLAEKGYDVLATSRSEQPHKAFLPYLWQKRHGTVRFQQIDINQDLEALEVLLKAEKPTHIVNFAAQSMVGESWIYPDHWMMTNVVSTVRLHDLLRRYDGMERYVHVTTPEVYGSTSGWVTEDHHFNPSTPYAVSRAAGDMSLRTYFQQYDFPVLFTRAANVYGPSQQLYRIIPRTIYAAMTGQKLKLDGGGKSIRVFIHMRDVSDATLRIAQKGTVGETYHISGYELVSIRDCVETILKTLGKNFDECVEIGPERAGKDTAYTLDSVKLRTALGWQDKISLEDGIADTIRWMQTFESDLANLPSKYIHKA
jgi:dTDP-glucose 4,6-dehydratase